MSGAGGYDKKNAADNINNCFAHISGTAPYTQLYPSTPRSDKTLPDFNVGRGLNTFIPCNPPAAML